MIRSFLKVVIYQVRKFWNRGTTLRFSFLGNMFFLGFLIIAFIGLSSLINESRFGLAAMVFVTLVVLIMAMIDANSLGFSRRKTQTLIDGVDPGDDFEDDLGILFSEKEQVRFPYSHLLVVTYRVDRQLFRDIFAACRKLSSQIVAYFRRLAEQADQDKP